MPATTPPTVSPLSDPPDTGDPANFDVRGDTFFQELHDNFQPQLVALGINVYDNAVFVEQVGNDVEARADDAETARDQAQSAALTAVNAPGTSGTSSTSTAVGSGTKTLITQTGKAWVVGQPVVISRTSAPTTIQMYGVISAYNGGTGSISVVVPSDGALGSGTYSDWTISLTGRRGQPGILPVLETTGDTVGVYGFCYHIMGNHKLTLPALGTVDQEIEFYNMSGLTTPTVDFGSTKLTTITGIKTPGLMTLEFPGCGARLRCTANATYGFRA